MAITLQTTNAERTEDIKEAGVSSWIMVGAFDWGQALTGLLLAIIFIQAVTIFVMALSNKKKPKVIMVNANGDGGDVQERRERVDNAPRPMEHNPPPPPPPAPVQQVQQLPEPVPEPPMRPVQPTNPNRLITVAQTGSCFHYATCNTLRTSSGLRHLRPCNACGSGAMMSWND